MKPGHCTVLLLSLLLTVQLFVLYPYIKDVIEKMVIGPETSYQATKDREAPEVEPLIVDPDSCATFDFDAVRWTVYVKKTFDKAAENEQCNKLHETIFKKKRVKRLIFANNRTENLGCTAKTPHCKRGAFWDHKRNIRVNLPPCCRQKVTYVFKMVAKELHRRRVTYVVVGGAVLGWLRNEQFVPYDHDVDILVDEGFWRPQNLKMFRKKMSQLYNFYTDIKDAGEKLGVRFSAKNMNGLDIWPMRSKWRKGKRLITTGHAYTKDQPYGNMLPPCPVRISGISTFVPNRPERYAGRQYGKNWRREMKCTKRSGRKCIE